MNPTPPTPSLDPHADVARARVGTLVEGRWSIEALIAVGGSSAIYAATHRNGMRVAMKVLDPDLADNQTAVSHFLREGRAVNGIAHPGVVSVLDEGTTADGAPFLLMPLLDGETAQQCLARHPGGLQPVRALAIVEAVLDVLSAAHASGIVHRDLKPDNIFLERSGAVRVLDFGIAHVESNMELTQVGTVVGTAGYLPPEQARGQVRECGPRSDLWSVGAMLYSLLTGRVLHEAPNVIQSILRAQHEHVAPARALIPGVSESVAHVLDGALAFDASDRWTDAVAMRLAVRAAIDDLRRAEARDQLRSCAGVTVDALAKHASPSDVPVAFDSVDAWRATRKPLAWIAAVCVSAAWVVVAAFVAHGRPAPVVVASAAPPPALEAPALVTGSSAVETLAPTPPEVTTDALPVVPVVPVASAVASAKAPVASKGPHRAREIVRQADF
jgi:eukaryotic-like serine/threonine-protein kinase